MVGWEKVDTLNASELFDTQCQYRAQMGYDGGFMLYFNVVAPNIIRGQFNIAYDARNNTDASILIYANTKAISRGYG